MGGCVSIRPPPIGSFHEYVSSAHDDTLFVSALRDSTFFVGVQERDLLDLARKCKLKNDLDIIPQGEATCYVGGVHLKIVYSNEYIKRKDVFGEDMLFANSVQRELPRRRRTSGAGPFARKRLSNLNAYEQTMQFRESLLRSTKIIVTCPPSRSLVSLERSDFEYVLANSESFKIILPKLQKRAERRTALLQTCMLSLLKSMADKAMFRQAFDYCELSAIPENPTDGCMYVICDGVIECYIASSASTSGVMNVGGSSRLNNASTGSSDIINIGSMHTMGSISNLNTDAASSKSSASGPAPELDGHSSRESSENIFETAKIDRHASTGTIGAELFVGDANRASEALAGPPPRRILEPETRGGEDDSNRICLALFGSGSVLCETLLLGTDKRFTGKCKYRVVENGVALVLTRNAFRELRKCLEPSDSSREELLVEQKLRTPQSLRAYFPIFRSFNDEMCELIMEGCTSVMYEQGAEIPKTRDLHLVRRGSVQVMGTVHRKSIGGPLFVESTIDHGGFPLHSMSGGGANNSTSSSPLSAPVAAAGGGGSSSPSSMVNISLVEEHGFFSQENVLRAMLPDGGDAGLLNRLPACSIEVVDSSDEESLEEDGTLPSTKLQLLTNPSARLSARAAVPGTVVWSIPAGLISYALSKDLVAKAEFEIVALKDSAPMDAFLRHPVGLYYYRNHLTLHHADENIDFYFAAKTFKELYSTKEVVVPPDILHDVVTRLGGDVTANLTWADMAAFRIYSEFIDDGAARQINIEGESRKRLQQIVKNSPVPRTAFEDAQSEVYKILLTDCFPRFKNSKKFSSVVKDIIEGKTLDDIAVVSPQTHYRSLHGFGSFRFQSMNGPRSSPLFMSRKMGHILVTSKSTGDVMKQTGKTKYPFDSSEDVFMTTGSGVRDSGVMRDSPITPRISKTDFDSPSSVDVKKLYAGRSLFGRDGGDGGSLSPSSNKDHLVGGNNNISSGPGLVSRIGSF